MATDAPVHEPAAGASGKEIARNLIAGLTVSFVAISLGAAFGELSGRGATSGILSAGVIALITSALGGTRIQCSGPTAPMTAVMLTAVAFANDPAGLLAAAPEADPVWFLNVVLILTGGLLVLMAVFRLGRFIEIVPKVVVSGFMNGIAVLIWVAEVKKLFALGDKPVLEGGIQANLLVAFITVVLCFTLPKLLKKLPGGIGHFLPGTLVAIIAMTGVIELGGFL
jgi:SulP family sulfate permease